MAVCILHFRRSFALSLGLGLLKRLPLDCSPFVTAAPPRMAASPARTVRAGFGHPCAGSSTPADAGAAPAPLHVVKISGLRGSGFRVCTAVYLYLYVQTDSEVLYKTTLRCHTSGESVHRDTRRQDVTRQYLRLWSAVRVALRYGDAKLILHSASPTGRPDRMAPPRSDSGRSDRPTLCRAQRRGENFEPLSPQAVTPQPQ